MKRNQIYHTAFPTNCSSWTSYKHQGMYTIHKLHPLATQFR